MGRIWWEKQTDTLSSTRQLGMDLYPHITCNQEYRAKDKLTSTILGPENIINLHINLNCKEHLTTDNGILVEQNKVKYLGITFDNTLSFSSHINQITQKISKVVGILWKARSLPLNIKLKIYYSLVYTHLNYAILVGETLSVTILPEVLQALSTYRFH